MEEKNLNNLVIDNNFIEHLTNLYRNSTSSTEEFLNSKKLDSETYNKIIFQLLDKNVLLVNNIESITKEFHKADKKVDSHFKVIETLVNILDNK